MSRLVEPLKDEGIEKFITTNKRTMTKTMWLTRMVKSCMDIILPPSCPFCGVRMSVAGSRRICPRCISAIQYLEPPFCRICGIELPGLSATRHEPLCGECLSNTPPFATARSIVRYDAQVKQLVHKLKYTGELSVIPGLVELIDSYDMADFAAVDRVVVVPLHIRRLRHRGFNQAAVLARLLFADRLNLIKPDWLSRTRNTIPQTELGGNARRKNLRGAFQVRATADLMGSRVCLVDDVFTTGTTVRECSKELLKSGAAEVRVLTLARVNISPGGLGRKW